MNDKVKHIIAGLVASFIVAFPAYLESNDLFVGIWTALTTSVIAGAVKEWCDNEYGIGWNWRDLGWTCLGGVAIVVLIILTHFAKG